MAKYFFAFIGAICLLFAIESYCFANEEIKSAVEQHVNVKSSGGLFVKNQKKDNAEQSCQGITIEKSGGIIIINQRVSDKDVLDTVDKK